MQEYILITDVSLNTYSMKLKYYEIIKRCCGQAK